MMPKWAYGFWQSRQRYNTQDEILGVLREYRKRKLPIDNVVQDWFYWPEDSWGCHCFDAKRFPDPQGMVDEIHRSNANVMISVWAKFYPTTENYKALDALGGIHRRQVEPRPEEPTDAGLSQGQLARLGRARLLQRLLRPVQSAGEGALFEADHRQPGHEELRRLVARFRRARFPLQPVDRRAPAPHEPERGRSRRGRVQQLFAGAHRWRLFEPAALQAGRPAVHPEPFGLCRHPAFQHRRSGRATWFPAGTTFATRFRRA